MKKENSLAIKKASGCGSRSNGLIVTECYHWTFSQTPRDISQALIRSVQESSKKQVSELRRNASNLNTTKQH